MWCLLCCIQTKLLGISDILLFANPGAPHALRLTRGILWLARAWRGAQTMKGSLYETPGDMLVFLCEAISIFFWVSVVSCERWRWHYEHCLATWCQQRGGLCRADASLLSCPQIIFQIRFIRHFLISYRATKRITGACFSKFLHPWLYSGWRRTCRSKILMRLCGAIKCSCYDCPPNFTL